MKDISFGASLDGAKLLAHAVDDKTVRRVQFKLGRPFSLEQAEWLEAEPLRQKLQRGELDAFEIPINAFHAKASFSGMAGNASAQVDGVAATAKMSGGEDPTPMLALTFEAFPEAALLTWLAASVKENVEVELLATQAELPLDPGTTPGVKTTSHRIEYERQIQVPGTAKPEKKAAKKGKGRRR